MRLRFGGLIFGRAYFLGGFAQVSKLRIFFLMLPIFIAFSGYLTNTYVNNELYVKGTIKAQLKISGPKRGGGGGY